MGRTKLMTAGAMVKQLGLTVTATSGSWLDEQRLQPSKTTPCK